MAGDPVPAADVSRRPMAQLLRLDGRVAVVTGGAQGLGAAIAERLAEAGAAVVIGDLDEQAARVQARSLAARHHAASSGLRVDVCEASDVHALADHAVSAHGRIDVWVNNAGIFPPAHPVNASAAEFERIMAVNVTGTHLGCQAAAAHMCPAGRGVIVNLASTAAWRGAGAYAASKWAVRGMTKGLARRLGPSGVRVVAVAPTMVTTPGTAAVRATGGAAMDRVLDAIVDDLPLGRAGVPDDVARAVVFLSCDAAAFITGVTLPVDGGELTD